MTGANAVWTALSGSRSREPLTRLARLTRSTIMVLRNIEKELTRTDDLDQPPPPFQQSRLTCIIALTVTTFHVYHINSVFPPRPFLSAETVETVSSTTASYVAMLCSPLYPISYVSDTLGIIPG